jgi:hypothetical protein
MTLLLWTIIIFLGVVILAVVVSPPSPEVPGDRHKLPRSSNRGGS